MLLAKMRLIAQFIGFACIVLLALYGAVALLGGAGQASAARLTQDAAPPASEPGSTSATVPLYMNYQGNLKDMAGNPLTGYYTMTFRVYTNVSAPMTGAIYTETQTGITVSAGRFNVLLGNATPMPEALFDTANRFLGVQVAPASDELVPRQRLASTPYAFHANTASVATHAVDGVPTGAIIIWDQSPTCPTGYTRVAGLDNRFPVGAGTAYGATTAATGGTAHHTHGFTTNPAGAHSHGMSGSGETEGKQHNDAHSRAAPANHTHAIYGVGDHAHTGTTAAGDPPYYTVLYCRKG